MTSATKQNENDTLTEIFKGTEEIYTQFEQFLKNLKKECHNREISFNCKASALEQEIRSLTMQIESEVKILSTLIAEETELTNKINADKESIAILQTENEELNNLLSNSNLGRKTINELISTYDTKILALAKKIENRNENLTKNNIKIKKKADYYKKYMGLEMEQKMYNVLKISFKKISAGLECYVLIDFSDSGEIVELCPSIMPIEHIQQCFQQNKDFYEFLKVLRGKFCEALNR